MRSKRPGKGLEMVEYHGLTQSLSGRSLGGLDRAAALPGQQAAVIAGAASRKSLKRKCSLGPEKCRGLVKTAVVVAALRTLSYV